MSLHDVPNPCLYWGEQSRQNNNGVPLAFPRKSGYTENIRATGVPEGEAGYGENSGYWASGF